MNQQFLLGLRRSHRVAAENGIDTLREIDLGCDLFFGFLDKGSNVAAGRVQATTWRRLAPSCWMV